MDYSQTSLDYYSNYDYAAVANMNPVVILLEVALAIFLIVAVWKVFTKAGKPGWASLIPIYNTVVMFQIGGKPWWWIFLLLIPIVNVVITVIALHGLSKNFGHGAGFTVGLFFLAPVFFPILAFGKSKYKAVA